MITMPNQKALMACAAAFFLLTTGCHVYHPDPKTPPAKAADALADLQSLPSLEDTKVQLTTAVAEVKTAANRLIPDLEWNSLHGESGRTCSAPFEQSDGKGLYLPDEVAAGADVSEQNWAKILASAAESAAKFGATQQQAMQDGPANHDVGFYGPTGIFIKVGYQGNLVISAYTGCRLPQDKKQPT